MNHSATSHKGVIRLDLDVPDVFAAVEIPEADYAPMDLAWAAGFMEGEGCFGWYGGTTRRSDRPHNFRSPNAVISVVQNEREPLERLQVIFGGVGRINDKRTRTRIAAEWRVQGHAAIPVMVALWPLMSPRRQERIVHVITEHTALQARKAARIDPAMCPQGHPRSKFSAFRANGKRYCGECSRVNARRYAARKKLAKS